MGKNDKKNKNKDLEKHIEEAAVKTEQLATPQVGSIASDLEMIKKHIAENFANHKETGVQQAVKDLDQLFDRVIDLVNFIDKSTKED